MFWSLTDRRAAERTRYLQTAKFGRVRVVRRLAPLMLEVRSCGRLRWWWHMRVVQRWRGQVMWWRARAWRRLRWKEAR